MKVVATYSQPTSVVDCFCSTLTEDEDTEYLVVARPSSLELYAIHPDALRLQCRFDAWGRIVSIQSVPSHGAEHHILVLTDHPDPRVLLLKLVVRDDDSKLELRCLEAVSLHERNARSNEFFNRCLVDRKGKVAVIATYVGRLKILELEDGRLKSNFDVSVRELNILSICFVPTASPRSLALAILHKDHRQAVILTSHEIKLSQQEFSDETSPYLSEVRLSQINATSIIPVPASKKSKWNTEGGIMVLVDGRILFYSLDKVKRRSKKVLLPQKPSTFDTCWPYSEIISCTEVDKEGLRFLLSDIYGNLSLLVFDLDSPKADLLHLGKVSSPSAMAVLPSNFLYVGSHYGDSQLIRIVPDRSAINGTFVEVVESYKNIAPIMDAVSADIDNSGQPALITCSGARGAGSLRIIRNGANFIVDARLISLPRVRRIWPLKRRFQDDFHYFLLISTHSSSHLVVLPDGQSQQRIPVADIITQIQVDAPTLASANILRRVVNGDGKSTYENSSFFVQVTPVSVLLLNTTLGNREDSWKPAGRDEIILADISPSQVCLALKGGKVVLLSIRDDKFEVKHSKVLPSSTGQAHAISALSLSIPKPGTSFATSVVIGTWSSHEVRVYSLPTFALEDKGILPHLPRSVLLFHFGSGEVGRCDFLMVGMANGSVAYSSYTKGLLGDVKSVSLGDSPILLNVYNANGRPAVLASGSRNAIFTRSGDTMNHSLILLKDVTSACSINTSAFLSCVVLSSADELVIGRVQELDKLHVRTLGLASDDPLKIAYMKKTNTIAVGCIAGGHDYRESPMARQNSIKFVDAVTFESRHVHLLDPHEEPTATAVLDLQVQDSTEGFFAAGTMYYDATEQEPTRGRLLLFSQQHEPLQLSAAVEAHGCVYSLAEANGRLVAAINTSVVLFGVQRTDEASLRLVRLSEWNHNYLVTHVQTSGDYIATGDAVASLAILQCKEDALTTVARDYSPLWPVCIDMINEQSIIGATSDSNLFSFKILRQGNKKVLERDGFYHYGEIVNKVVIASPSSIDSKHEFKASRILFTSSGRISVVVDLDDIQSRLLSELERNMATVLMGPGNMEHNKWRAPTSYRGRSDAHSAAVGFLDGDFLERFLDYPELSPEIARIMAGKNEAESLKTSYADLRSILESLRSTH